MPLAAVLGIGAVLVIICLVVRDRTESRIQKMRAELMALRKDERRHTELREEIETTCAQATEALMRADRRCNSLRKGCEVSSELYDQIEAYEAEGAPVRDYDEQRDESEGDAESDEGGRHPGSGRRGNGGLTRANLSPRLRQKRKRRPDPTGLGAQSLFFPRIHL